MHLHLTESGKVIAQQVYNRHCFFRQLLIDCGVTEDAAEEDACRMEHAISEDSFQKLKKNFDTVHGSHLYACSSF